MAISIIIVALLAVLFKSVARDWAGILKSKNEIETLTKEYEALLNEEEKLVSEVTKLQDKDYIVRYAKEKFLYSGEGETIIRMN